MASRKQTTVRTSVAHHVTYRLVVTGQYENGNAPRYTAHRRGERAPARHQLVEAAPARDGKPTLRDVWVVDWKGGTRQYLNPIVHFNPSDMANAVATA